MSKDWTGNKRSTYATLGASNHSEHEREQHDYYATEPKAAELLLGVESLDNIWECAVGEGHLAKVFAAHGKLDKSTDLIDRGYGMQQDFLACETLWSGDIVTNPPYKYASQFVTHGLSLVQDGRKVAMFLKLTFLEGKARKALFSMYPPKYIYVCSGRLKCAINGDFDNTGQSAAAYAWFVWYKGFDGEPTVRWIN